MGLVVASRPDGIGTRLLTILCARRFAERIGYDFRFTWPSLKENHYDYSANLLQKDDFFEIFARERIFADSEGEFGALADTSVLEGRRLFSILGAYGRTWTTTTAGFREDSASYDVILYDHPTILRLGDDRPDADAAALKAYWNSIRWNRDVEEAYRRFAATAQLATSPAIHMRRGDIAAMIHEADFDYLRSRGITVIFQRYLPVSTAFRELREKFAAAKNIVICSEDRGIPALFEAEFPGVAFHTSFGVFDDLGNKKALLDLMILAGCQDLISPFKSYYSECAASVGSCRLTRSDLDVFALTRELGAIIDGSAAPNKIALKVLVLVFAWRNLWHCPDLPERANLLEASRALDPELTQELLDI
jgi:hypothetical protein